MMSLPLLSFLLELLNLIHKLLYTLVCLILWWFLALEEALSHQYQHHPWKYQYESDHRKVTRQLLDFSHIHKKAGQKGLEGHRYCWNYGIWEHLRYQKDWDHLSTSQNNSHIHERCKVLIGKNAECSPIRVEIKGSSIEKVSHKSEVDNIKRVDHKKWKEGRVIASQIWSVLGKLRHYKRGEYSNLYITKRTISPPILSHQVRLR